MNMIQMAWRSVIRKPGKSILLFLVIFVISTLLLASMASQNASVQVQDDTRQALGAGLLLETNQEYRSRRIMELSEKIGDDKEGSLEGYYQKKIVRNGAEFWQTGTDNSFETLDLEDIEKIREVSGISDYNITTAVTAVNPVNFSRIEEEQADQSADLQGVSLIGERNMALDANVLSGNVSIKEGRMAGPEDTQVCVISQELAEKNQLSLGDELSFNDCHDRENSKVYSAKIIGIYQTQSMMQPMMAGDTYRSENVIFTDLYFPNKAEGEESPLFEKAYFQVGNVDDYETVKERVRQVPINWERYDLIDRNGNLELMSSNFNDLKQVSLVMTWAVSGAGLAILFLVFLFWMKSRTREMGVFLALGMSRARMAGQVLTEGAMIACLAAMLSFAAAPGASALAADRLVWQQVQESQEQKQALADSGSVATDYQEPEQKVEQVEVKITGWMCGLDGLAVISLVGVSVLASAGVMLGRHPRDILSRMS